MQNNHQLFDVKPRTGALAKLLGSERRLLCVVALIGATRIFLLSAAFPLFNNVDEYSHFDAVYKYSRGELPHPDRLHYDSRSSSLIIWLGSPEYIYGASRVPGAGYPRPPWSVSPESARARLREGMRRLAGLKNHELAQPPVYYAICGAWYRLAELLGLACGHLVFSIRWLNAMVMVGLVFTTHRLACAAGGRDLLSRIGAPLLVAMLPQDALYSISNDALSPLLVALALVAILRMHASHPRPLVSLLAGLLVALAVLTKYTNCVILVPAFVLTAMRLWGSEVRPRGWLWCSALFWFVAIAPVVAWGMRNAALFGDPTAMRLIFEPLGWQPKPLAAWLDHPLFSFRGLLHFLDDLCRDFWRGRFMWNGEFMAHPLADFFYVATSGIFLAAAAAGVARELLHRFRTREGLSEELRVGLAAWLLVAGGVTLLALLSLRFEFPERGVPSRDDPYFTMGRLIAGCIAPFALIYVSGLGTVTEWISSRGRTALRAGLFGFVLATILVSEMWLSLPAARSNYNWFRLQHVAYGPCATASPSRSETSDAREPTERRRTSAPNALLAGSTDSREESSR